MFSLNSTGTWDVCGGRGGCFWFGVGFVLEDHSFFLSPAGLMLRFFLPFLTGCSYSDSIT